MTEGAETDQVQQQTETTKDELGGYLNELMEEVGVNATPDNKAEVQEANTVTPTESETEPQDQAEIVAGDAEEAEAEPDLIAEEQNAQQDEISPVVEPTVAAPVIRSSGSQKIPGVYKAQTVASNPLLTNAVASGMVTDKSLISMGLDHLNRGMQNIHAAQKDAGELRKSYEKAARKHRNAKWGLLTAESALMGVFSYDMIEDWTGLQGTPQATATNVALTGGLAGLRAYVQYEMMKRGEDALKKGNKISGYFFSVIGLAIAAANAVFVAHGFGKRSIEQTQELAMVKLDEISDQQAGIFQEKTAEQTQINQAIDDLDAKILEIQSGARDPAITAIDEEMQRLEERLAEIRDHENNNDGKYDWWDKQALIDSEKYSQRVAELAEQKKALLSDIGNNMSPSMQKMFDATTNQRLDLDKQIAGLDERYGPQLDALQASRGVWEAKLENSTSAGDNVLKAMTNNPITLLEGVVMGAGISIANWAAAHQGQKQEELEMILSGEPDNPWSGQSNDNDPLCGKSFNKSAAPAQMFLGYNFAGSQADHLRNEAHINALAESLNNPEAMRTELRAEVQRQHGKMVEVLNQQFSNLPEALYVQRLEAINTAFAGALEAVNSNDVLAHIEDLVMSAQTSIPTFDDPNDPALAKLPVGAQFKTPDGTLRLKSN